MTIFITGSTGYLGSYVVDHLLREGCDRLALLVRATSREQAEQKLWRALQLHMDGPAFWEALSRIDFIHGDLTAPELGIDRSTRKTLVHNVDSVLHIAASLNRKSERACLNTNLRGTLSVIKLARAIADSNGLGRFSHVSTVAVAGEREREVVQEDEAIDWQRRDYDPYARTKKFCEHMVRELLPDTPRTFFRPAIIMGDPNKPETTQFDMVRALCVLADLPVAPLRSDVRLDIANADFVGRAVATVHKKANPKHEIYHLSSGTSSETAGEIAHAICAANGRPHTRFVPALGRPFAGLIKSANLTPGRHIVSQMGALMKVFWPYITYDTVFDNRRIVEELGEAPVPFTGHCGALYRYAKGVGFKYDYQELPPRPTTAQVPAEIQA